MVFSTVEEAIRDVKRGRMVVVVDDENRENEGDLVLAAEKATADKINFMISHARGLVCMPMERKRLEELSIPPMVDHKNVNRCMFTISVDYLHGTTTGISPADRAATIQALIHPDTKPQDFAQPGHLFPLIYKEGGVLVREGHTEASVDLARLAGLYPASVICEVINEDGSMAKLTDLQAFTKKHDLRMITIEALTKFISYKPDIVEQVQLANG